MRILGLIITASGEDEWRIILSHYQRISKCLREGKIIPNELIPDSRTRDSSSSTFYVRYEIGTSRYFTSYATILSILTVFLNPMCASETVYWNRKSMRREEMIRKRNTFSTDSILDEDDIS